MSFDNSLYPTILDVTGQASLDGTLRVDFIGFIPPPDAEFTLLKAGSIVGDLTALDILGIKCPTCTFDPSTGILDTGSSAPSGTPEPSTLVLFGIGLLGLAWRVKRKVAVSD